jgi:hypothetical protein
MAVSSLYDCEEWSDEAISEGKILNPGTKSQTRPRHELPMPKTFGTLIFGFVRDWILGF